MSITKQFLNAFDTNNKDHCLWLCELHDGTQQSKDPKTSMVNNPFGIKITEKETLAWIDIMVAMSIKYTMASLKGDAWWPPKS
jgi:hypothetical protein